MRPPLTRGAILTDYGNMFQGSRPVGQMRRRADRDPRQGWRRPQHCAPALGSRSGPDDVDIVGLQAVVVGHQHQTLAHRLGDQHAIEGVVVMTRQRGQRLGMTETDRQLVEPAGDNAGLEALGQFQLAERDLDCRQALATLTKTTLADAMRARRRLGASCSPATR
jgi:hypothetical protein